MNRNVFLLITAVAEGLTGLLLIVLPAVLLDLLLGVPAAAAETLLLARVAGTAMIAIGVTSGMAHGDGGGPALRAVLTGLLVYNVAVAAVLAYAGLGAQLAGVLLWPVVAVHVALAIWCIACLRTVSPG